MAAAVLAPRSAWRFFTSNFSQVGHRDTREPAPKVGEAQGPRWPPLRDSSGSGGVTPYLREVFVGLTPAAGNEAAGRAVLEALLAAHMPEGLLGRLGSLDLEERKEATRVFAAALRLASRLGMEASIAQHMRARPQIPQLFLDGCEDPDVALHCFEMLRECTRYPEVASALFDAKVATGLVALAQHPSVDVSLDAFASLRALLLSDERAVAAAFLEANFGAFFEAYNKLLVRAEAYATQRQALRLLGDLLRDPQLLRVRQAYANEERFLQIHMNLLRDSSRSIREDAFHIFAIFACNPRLPPKVHLILFRNSERLAKVLEAHGSTCGGELDAESDARIVACAIRRLGPPAPWKPAAATQSQCQDSL